jgi:hypothetical protein
VPPQQRLRRYNQSITSARRQQAGERRHKRAIGRPQPRAPVLPAKYG